MRERKPVIQPDESRWRETYARGFVGAYYNAASAQHLRDTISQRGGQAYGEEAVRFCGLAGIGAGKLSLPFLAVTQHFPQCFPGFAQKRGDCVAHSTRSAIWMSYMNEIVYGQNPDRHSVPTLTTTGEKSGCISSSSLYWYRGHSGDGWVCAEAAEVAITKSAMWLCQDYPELGIDLTQYNPDVSGKWGSKPPPDSVTEVGQRNLCKNAAVCRTYESVRDMLATGNAISSCGSEAFENKRDKHGVARRALGEKWYHAMAYGGVDDRPETIEREGCGLVLVGNSWGPNWISGETLIPGTKLHIPHGWFWARWDDIDARYAVAFGASVGWPARRHPNWGLEGIV